MTDHSSETPQKRERPLSPHLQVYRLPYNAKMSIMGRMVGIGLVISLMAVLSWFVAVVWSPALYDQSMVLLDNPYTKYVFIAWAFLIFFYIGNGIRHVLWDMGIGVNEKAGIATGNTVLLLAAIFTFGLWQLSCGCWTGYFSSEVEILEGAQNVE